MNWYYVRNGERVGPVDEAALRRLIAEGTLRPEDLVWNETMGDQWAAASTIPGLYAPPQLPLAAAPTPAGIPGQTPNKELMARARASLEGQWGNAVVVALIYFAITMGLSMLPFASLLIYLVAGPFYLGLTMYFLSVVRRRPAEVGQVFQGFQQFGRATGTYLLMVLLILLWMLLLIIPGIIMSYAYMMTFFILADDPQVGMREAMRRSVDMMRGHKWKLFCLYFRFLGWALLAMLTCGIGYLWLVPYMQAALTHFYEDVRLSPGTDPNA